MRGSDEATPLIFRGFGSPKLSLRRAACLSLSVLAVAVSALCFVSWRRSTINLQQEMLSVSQGIMPDSAPLFYIPKQSVGETGELPLHIEVPVGQKTVKYTLIRSPPRIQDLEQGANASSSSLSCFIQGVTKSGTVKVRVEISDRADDVVKMWNQCKYAPDYVEPNKNKTRRRLLETSVPDIWHYPNTPKNEILPGSVQCGGLDFTCPSQGECEKLTSGELCADLKACNDPVCTNYYNTPLVERVCGICKMAETTPGCFSSWFQFSHCIGMTSGANNAPSDRDGGAK